MTTLIADIEADGLLDTITTIHQLSILDADTGELESYNGRERVRSGVFRLNAADAYVFHNGLGYDLPAIQKVIGVVLPWEKCIDTLVLSRLGNPERQGHSLAVWGERVGVAKVEHSDWSKWTPAMEQRCNSDVAITYQVFARLRGMLTEMPEAVAIEHAVANEVAKMMARGLGIDVYYVRALAHKLRAQQEQQLRELQAVFPPVLVSPAPKSPVKELKNVNSTHPLRGALDPNVPYCPVVVEEFNPASRQQVAKRLIARYGWRPSKFTASGQPEVSEDTLAALPYDEAVAFREYLKTDKLLGFIEGAPRADGSGGGWLHHERGGRVYASINPCRAVTGRPACSSPNLQQVPSDKVMRRAFVPTSGRVLVGVDAEGLELRCLAHYLARYDNGVYAKEVVEGDIHTRVMDLIGFRLSDDPEVVKKVNRQNTKRVEYALIYGAGDAMLGRIAYQNAQETGVEMDYARYSLSASGKRKPAASTVGSAIRDMLEEGIVGLGPLTDTAKARARAQGKLKGLDGRTLWVRSPHSVLNLLLQSAGIIIIKKAMTLAHANAAVRGLREGEHYWPVMWIHDEWQIEALPECAEEVGQAFAATFQSAGLALGFRCPLSGSYNIGSSWAETH